VGKPPSTTLGFPLLAISAGNVCKPRGFHVVNDMPNGAMPTREATVDWIRYVFTSMEQPEVRYDVIGNTFRAQVVRIFRLEYRFGEATGNSCIFISVSAREI
jgi:hypothetical protein